MSYCTQAQKKSVLDKWIPLKECKAWTLSHPLSLICTPTVRKSAGRMKAADAVAISGGSIRGTAALQMEVFKAYSHTFFICDWLWGRRGGRLQLKASNNKPGLSETKGRWGKGTWNEKQQKSFVYNRWTKRCKQSQCLAAKASRVTNITPAIKDNGRATIVNTVCRK